MPLHEATQRRRGFFTIAQNSGSVDYVRMAYGLALSLKVSQRDVSHLSIGITPGTKVDERYAWAFDNIIEVPWGDHAADSEWKLENEWKVIHMTPYDETIKLDCDMLFFNDIDQWWEQMSADDLCICNRVVNYRGHTVSNDYYRKAFTANALPDVYTAFMYLKKTDMTHELYDLAKIIYFNWERFFEEHISSEHRPPIVSTDMVFALALKILDLDQRWYTTRLTPVFTHMKSQLQGWQHAADVDDWTSVMSVFFNPELECKIGNYLQYFPLHYHIKSFLTDEMISYYERRLSR